jgi:hypothetical protein
MVMMFFATFQASIIACSFIKDNYLCKFSCVTPIAILLLNFLSVGNATAVPIIKSANVALAKKLTKVKDKKETKNYSAKKTAHAELMQECLKFSIDKNNYMFGKNALALKLRKRVNPNLNLNFSVKPRGIGLRFVYNR